MDLCFVLFLFYLHICVCVWLQVQGPLRECPRAGRFRATLLLRTTCMRSCCNWRTTSESGRDAGRCEARTSESIIQTLILSSVPYVWSITWEVYWDFMYRIVCITGGALRSTVFLRLLPWPCVAFDLKVIQEKNSRFVTRRKQRDEMKQRNWVKDQETRRVCAVSGSCLVQRPMSFIYPLLKAVPRWYNEGQSGVSVLTVISICTTTTLSSGALLR